MENKELELRRLELEEKKTEQEYLVRLKEIGLKEADARRSRWSNPLVLSIVAATIAAAGNAYISWLNGSNQLAVESTRNAALREIEQEKAEAERILEATKSSSPGDAEEKLKFLIAVGLIANPNRQAALEAYLTSEARGTASSSGDSPLTEGYASGWLGGGNNQLDQCNIGRAVVAQKHPGKYVLLKSSYEQSRRDIFGRVEYRYLCNFEVR
jgi:hypothetical protein